MMLLKRNVRIQTMKSAARHSVNSDRNNFCFEVVGEGEGENPTGCNTFDATTNKTNCCMHDFYLCYSYKTN